MLVTQKYIATPHPSDKLRHTIPTDVIKSLTTPERKWLDGQECLFQVLVVRKGKVNQIPPVILKPVSGGEVRFRKQDDYPDSFSAGDYLIVEITPLP